MIGLLLALMPGEAQATRVNVGLSPAVQLHTGPRALAVGVGPLASVRVNLTEGLSAQAQLGVFDYGPAFVQANLGVLYSSRPLGLWRPSVGLELASTWGGVLRIYESTEDWKPTGAPVFAPRVMLQPLHFRTLPWTVSALNLSVGTGLESFGKSLSLGVELLSVQYQF